jgi:aromatic ring hydroxylase
LFVTATSKAFRRNASAAKPIRCFESLRDGREVWIDGERVEDVATHPAFKDVIGQGTG